MNEFLKAACSDSKKSGQMLQYLAKLSKLIHNRREYDNIWDTWESYVVFLIDSFYKKTVINLFSGYVKRSSEESIINLPKTFRRYACPCYLYKYFSYQTSKVMTSILIYAGI